MLSSLGLGWYDQRGSIRHYMFHNRQTGDLYDFSVNTARNQWISRRDNKLGKAADLIDYLRLPKPGKPLHYEHFLLSLMIYYDAQNRLPVSYPSVNLHVSKDSFVSMSDVGSHETVALLTHHGISAKTADDCGVKEMKLLLPGSNKQVSQLAFPTDNGYYMLFDGKTFRPLHDKSISTIGDHRQFQVCNVFENWLDYLAFQERRHQTGQYQLAQDYFLIINGKENLKQAMDFLRTNPDFTEVRSFMPHTEEGRFLTREISQATQGTAIDCSRYYAEAGSLMRDIRPVPPGWVEKIRNDEETARKKAEEQERRVRAAQKSASRNGSTTAQTREKEVRNAPKRKGFRL